MGIGLEASTSDFYLHYQHVLYFWEQNMIIPSCFRKGTYNVKSNLCEVTVCYYSLLQCTETDRRDFTLKTVSGPAALFFPPSLFPLSSPSLKICRIDIILNLNKFSVSDCYTC